MYKAQLVRDTVDMLGVMLPLEWTDPQGRHISILQTGLGRLYKDGIFKQIPDSDNPAWFRIMVDGIFLNSDGWYGFANPPIAIIVDGIIKFDMLAAFFAYVEQAVS